MAEIIIADKPTLDAVNDKAGAIQRDVGELKETAEKTEQTIDTIHSLADTLNTNLTDERTSNLDSLDVAVSTRATQASLDGLQDDVLTLKTALEDLSAGGSQSGATSTKMSTLHYAHGEISTDNVLLTINGKGRLRAISVRADGIPIAFWLFADGGLLDERSGDDVAFSETLVVTLKKTIETAATVVLFAVYDLEV